MGCFCEMIHEQRQANLNRSLGMVGCIRSAISTVSKWGRAVIKGEWLNDDPHVIEICDRGWATLNRAHGRAGEPDVILISI